MKRAKTHTKKPARKKAAKKRPPPEVIAAGEAVHRAFAGLPRFEATPPPKQPTPSEAELARLRELMKNELGYRGTAGDQWRNDQLLQQLLDGLHYHRGRADALTGIKNRDPEL